MFSASRFARGSDRFTTWTRSTPARTRCLADSAPIAPAPTTTALRPASPSSFAVGHAERHRHHRRARGVDPGLGVHPLADRQRALRQLVQGAPDGVVGLGGRIGAADLAEHLLLADDRRVQAAGHREQVLDGRLGVAHVGVLGQVVERHAGVLGQHLADHRKAAVEGLDDGVDLDAVAGGQHHRLGHQRGLQHLVDDLGLIGLVGAQLLQHRHRRAAVRNPEKQHAHGFITTSTKVIVDQLGTKFAVLFRSRPPALRRVGPQLARGVPPSPVAVPAGSTSSAREIRPQPRLVDLPVTVLAAVEQHHRQPVAELGAQRGVARGRGRRRRR